MLEITKVIFPYFIYLFYLFYLPYFPFVVYCFQLWSKFLCRDLKSQKLLLSEQSLQQVYIEIGTFYNIFLKKSSCLVIYGLLKRTI